ncbi:hypothetical protein ANMWB30_41600 [Arthrobacter sp. MWB30]|nr:hypothetical protein ANMWB30_41600 [Arthrobacter sp. MWB30]
MEAGPPRALRRRLWQSGSTSPTPYLLGAVWLAVGLTVFLVRRRRPGAREALEFG